MFIHKRRGWETPERFAEPGAFVPGRQAALPRAAGTATIDTMMPSRGGWGSHCVSGHDITAKVDSKTYNNYYELGADKSTHCAAGRLPTDPLWIECAGMVDKPWTMELRDILQPLLAEERIYSRRRVENWAMIGPWNGYADKKNERPFA